jgi:hypothetical protein
MRRNKVCSIVQHSSKNEAIGALSSGWRLVNWRSLIETSGKREGSLADGFAMLATTADPAIMPKLRDESFQDDLLQGKSRA